MLVGFIWRCSAHFENARAVDSPKGLCYLQKMTRKRRRDVRRPTQTNEPPQVTFPWRRVLIPLFLLALIAASSVFKVREAMTDSSAHRSFKPNDDTGYFWTESAFQYRLAKMVANGGDLPAIDRDAQYPEGLNLNKDMTVAMEYSCGHLYRALAPKIPFHLFALIFLAVISSTGILAVYMAANLITESESAAGVAALAFALSPQSYARVVSTFEYESFTLPLLFLMFTLTLWLMASRTYRSAAVRGTLVGCAATASLLSWHLASFLDFGLFAIPAFYSLVFLPDEDDAPRFGLAVAGGIVVLAALILPPLRAKSAVASMLSSSIFAYAASDILRRDRRGLFPDVRLWGLLYLLLIGVFVGLAYWLNPEKGMYGHVYQLGLAKLKCFLVKPDSPATISFEARSLWLGAFNTPSLATIALYFFPAILFPAWIGLSVLGGLARDLIFGAVAPRTPQSRSTELAYLAGAFALALFIVVDRLSVFLIFFVAVLFGHAFTVLRNRSRRQGLTAVAVVVIAGVWSTCTWDKSSFEKEWLRRYDLIASPPPYNTPSTDVADLTNWIKHATRPGDPILAPFPLSSQILADADRPIILNPKFESAVMRSKYKEFMQALYGSEEDLYRFAVRYGAKYFVYEPDSIIDVSKDSSRYIADRLNLPPDSPVVAFQFYPERLKHFEFVHQNTFYRVFAVRSAIRAASSRKPYRTPWFDPGLFEAPHIGTGPAISQVARIQEKFNTDVAAEAAAMNAAAAGNFQAGYQILADRVPASANPAWMTTDIGTIVAMSGNVPASIALLRQAIARDPNLAYAHKQLAIISLNARQIDVAFQEAQAALHLDEVDPDLWTLVGNIYEARGDVRRAVDSYRAAIDAGSNDPSLKSRLDALTRRRG